MPPRRQIQRMFGAIAHRYDLLNHLLSLQIDRLWRRRTVRRAGVVRGTRVLDVCCGTGDLSFAFSRSGARVVGADFCAEMIALAHRKNGAKPHPGAREQAPAFLLADAMCLPFPDGCFDLTTVAFGIRNVEDIAGGLREMLRVLRPGGRLLLLEFSRPPSRFLRWAYHLYFHHLLPRIGALIAGRGGEAYRYLPESVTHFPDPQTLAALMRAAGAASVRYELLSFGIAALHSGVKEGEASP